VYEKHAAMGHIPHAARRMHDITCAMHNWNKADDSNEVHTPLIGIYTAYARCMPQGAGYGK